MTTTGQQAHRNGNSNIYMQLSLPSPESETWMICLFSHRDLISIWDAPASQPWTEFKQKYLSIAFCKLILLPPFFFLFFKIFLPLSFLCMLMHSNTRLFLKHSSFVYLSIPIADLGLSGCCDHTIPCDLSLCGNASTRVGVFHPSAR